MRRRVCAFLLAIVLSSLSAFPVSAEGASDDTLSLSCASAILMEKRTGTILYDRSSHEKLPPASVTKIMTLLLVMEALDSGKLQKEDLVTVSAHAAGMGGSQVYLKEGEQMCVDELIKCVAVVSGNDCAVALAEHLEGSETAFVARMNERAAQLGMKDTTFMNCTGLPAQGHITSAYDIALMSRELILNHPDIHNYTTVWMDSIRDGTFGLTNTNRLIRFYPGATGLKTGSTDEALYCISATAQRDDMELIAVIMKAPTTAQRFDDAKTLLDYGFAGYTLKEVYPDAPLLPVKVLLGQQMQVQPELSRSCCILVEKSQIDQITTRVTMAEDVQAPVETCQILGQMEVHVNGELLDCVPIVASQRVDRLSVPMIFVRLIKNLAMTE